VSTTTSGSLWIETLETDTPETILRSQNSLGNTSGLSRHLVTNTSSLLGTIIDSTDAVVKHWHT
jgi:hypothetical protein